MFRTFWTKTSSSWFALLSIILGVILLFFPSLSFRVFSLGLGGVLIISGLFLVLQSLRMKKAGVETGGELVIGLIAAGMGLLFLSVPKMLVSILPFLLGALLVLLGVCNFPAAREAFRTRHPGRRFLTVNALVPLLLGLILVINPFGLITSIISFFGICLIISGVLELSGVMYMKRR